MLLLRCHNLVTSISKSLHFLSFPKILSDYTLVLIGTGIWMRKQVLSLWISTTMSGLFAWMALSVWISKSHKMVVFLFSMTFGGLCSHQFLFMCQTKVFTQTPVDVLTWSIMLIWIFYGCLYGTARHKVVNGLSLSHTLHFGSAPFFNMFAWKFLGGRLWSCDAQISDPINLATDGSVKNLHQDN